MLDNMDGNAGFVVAHMNGIALRKLYVGALKQNLRMGAVSINKSQPQPTPPPPSPTLNNSFHPTHYVSFCYFTFQWEERSWLKI